MSLSLMIALVTCPALLATHDAINQGQAKDRREEHRARRCNLIANCVKSNPRSRELDNRRIILWNSKLWVDIGTSDGLQFGHPFSGYYLPYPDTTFEGLVSSITEDPPVMNWIYIDKDTYEVKYGVRADAQPNITGPFDCTKQDRRLIFQGWEGFVAVEEDLGLWALYFDLDDDGLKSKVSPDKMVLEIELVRREKRVAKPEARPTKGQ